MNIENMKRKEFFQARAREVMAYDPRQDVAAGLWMAVGTYWFWKCNEGHLNYHGNIDGAECRECGRTYHD